MLVAEDVQERGQVARQRLLVARFVGHPHRVVQAFPQFERFGERQGFGVREVGAERGEGAVAGCAVWNCFWLGDRFFGMLGFVRHLGMGRLTA